MTTNNKSRLLPIIVMVILFGIISFVTNLAAPMGVIVKAQFQFSNFLGILGSCANFLAYACMGIPSGILLQKYGYRKTALTGIAIGLVGVFIQYLSGVFSSFTIYLTGAFVAGFSMCVLNTVVNPMLNTLGGGGNKGNQLIQVGGSFYSFMGIVTPIFVGALVGEVTKNTVISNVNPLLFMAMGIFAMTFVALLSLRLPEPDLSPSPSPQGRGVDTHDSSTQTHELSQTHQRKYSAWSFRHFVLGSIGVSCSVGVEVGIAGTMNLFLTDMTVGVGGKLTAEVAGFVTGTYFLLMVVGRFIGASVGARVSGRTMLASAMTLGIALLLAAIFLPVTVRTPFPVFTGGSFVIADVPINALFLVLTGLCTSVMWGCVYNLAVDGLGKYLASASGIFMMMVGGGALLMMAQNQIADMISYMASYWVPLAGFAYLLFYALKGSVNVNKDIPIEPQTTKIDMGRSEKFLP
ncbi:MAG: MFS transporter [Prevotellaceae bacterium]|jgi:FHS family L-fucose permease-like MFS transporter|nr:MFS transporter [Prevotellaceae bacterium]